LKLLCLKTNYLQIDIMRNKYKIWVGVGDSRDQSPSRIKTVETISKEFGGRLPRLKIVTKPSLCQILVRNSPKLEYARYFSYLLNAEAYAAHQKDAKDDSIPCSI
jgi:hypothetical protein